MTHTPDGNLALKCTFNDLRRRPGTLGFVETCSDENIARNVAGPTARTWCSLSPCATYAQGGYRGAPPKLPCYESALFTAWRFGTGIVAHGTPRERADVPRHARPGKIALLTTRFPGQTEAERVVVGVLHIADVTHDPTWSDSAFVQGDRALSFRVPDAGLLPYWSFKSGRPAWNHHLYRYISDGEAKAYLDALLNVVEAPDLRSKVEKARRRVIGMGALR